MWYKQKRDKAYLSGNVEYIEKVKGINPEDLGKEFQKRVELEIPNLENILLELGIKKETTFFSQLKNKLNRQQIIDLTEKFFKKIIPKLATEMRDIINGKIKDTMIEMPDNNGQNNAMCLKCKIPKTEFGIPEDMIEEIKKTDPDLYQRILEMSVDKTIMKIIIPYTGTIQDLYNFVHELTHFYADSKKTSTERLLDEVAPQCMERLLDDFLLALTYEELEEYNIVREDLKDDIRVRNIETFFSRYITVKKFNSENKKENPDEMIKEENLQYILAQIYQSQFLKYNIKDRKIKILEFIEYIKSNDLIQANRVFGIDWKNEMKRKNYIDITVNDAKKIIGVQRDTEKPIAGKMLRDLGGETR